LKKKLKIFKRFKIKVFLLLNGIYKINNGKKFNQVLEVNQI